MSLTEMVNTHHNNHCGLMFTENGLTVNRLKLKKNAMFTVNQYLMIINDANGSINHSHYQFCQVICIMLFHII